MLPWKPETQEESVLKDYFFCPKCDNVSPYKEKKASVDFTFYYLPLLEIEDLDRYVVCQVCKKGFNPKILEPQNQQLFRLVWVAKRGLLRFTPEALKSKLLKDGYKEPLIDKLLLLAQN